jgi:hypothetical protein
MYEGYAAAMLSNILLLSGDPGAAEAMARKAVDLGREIPSAHTYAIAMLAAILLEKGDTEGALKAASEAHASVENANSLPAGKALIWLVYAEALRAACRVDEASAVIASARDRVLRMAPDENEPTWRASYLENVRENARILELSRAWLGDPSPERASN